MRFRNAAPEESEAQIALYEHDDATDLQLLKKQSTP